MGKLVSSKWSIRPGFSGRYSGHFKSGWTGNHVTPTPYVAYGGKYGPVPSGSPTYQPDPDIPNTAFVSRFYGPSSPFPHARNQAWGKLVDKVREGPAQLGVALAEFDETFGMVSHRLSQCYRGYRDLRRGDFRGFLKQFGITPKSKHRNRVRSGVNEASSLWLEYSFGWKPAFQDVHDGLTAVSQPVPGGPVSGSGNETYAFRYQDPNGVGENFSTRGVCKQGADVFVSNPNLYLAQQLGLANPAQVAWELVPFSFVVDWVFDVGSFLGGFTDLLGCDIQNAYTTYFAKASVISTWGRPFKQCGGYLYAMRRIDGLSAPLPNLSIRANLGSSLNRAANAASLLGQIMTG